MAAGRHANPRREFSHRPRSTAHEVETGYAREPYAGGRNTGNSHSLSGIATVATNKDDRICIGEQVKEIHPAKKCKFSPVKWDKEDANARARVSSKYGTYLLNKKHLRNGDVHLNSVSLDVIDVCDDVDATNKLQDLENFPKSDVEFRSAESTLTESPTLSYISSSKEVLSGDKMPVEDVGHTSSLLILKSRWASDDNTPVCHSPGHSEYAYREIDSAYRHSRPEYGEFSRGDSASRISLSLSDDDRENDSGTVVVKDNHDSMGDITDSFFEDEDEDVIKVPRNVIWDSCRSVFDYERLNKINEGTYGVVYRARNRITGEIVALKKVKLEGEREGFPITALREIKFLMSVDHPSIVRGKEIVMGDLDSVFVVMEYMEHDLKGLMEVMKHPFSISEVKCLMLQLLEGIQYLHDNWVIHRDLKSSNILFNNQGELKICDFGMARQYANPLKPYTALVVTLWYRAPEILFGTKQYSEAIDMWSVGCIMAELLSKEPLFQGKTEVDQIDKILRLLGTPNDTIWPGFSELPGAKAKFVKQQYNMLRKRFPVTSFTGSPALSDAGFDLLNRMLTYDPVKRITVHDALNHPWFQEVPMAKAKEFMPTYPAQNAKDRTCKQAPPRKREKC